MKQQQLFGKDGTENPPCEFLELPHCRSSKLCVLNPDGQIGTVDYACLDSNDKIVTIKDAQSLDTMLQRPFKKSQDIRQKD